MECYGLDLSDEEFGARDGRGHLRRYPSEVDRLLKIIAEAGEAIPPLGEVDLGIRIPYRETRRIDSLWQQINIQKDELIIAFRPGSTMPAKRWPLDRFVEVARRLLADFTRWVRNWHLPFIHKPFGQHRSEPA